VAFLAMNLGQRSWTCGLGWSRAGLLVNYINERLASRG
jgi:hypothetical protein